MILFMPFEVSPVLQERCIRKSATIEVEKQFDHDRLFFYSLQNDLLKESQI